MSNGHGILSKTSARDTCWLSASEHGRRPAILDFLVCHWKIKDGLRRLLAILGLDSFSRAGRRSAAVVPP